MKKRKKKVHQFVLIILFISFLNLSAQPSILPKWIITESSTYSDLNKVIMFSPTSGIAAGRNIIVYNGNSWEKMETEPPFDISLTTANSIKSIFIASNNVYQESDMFHWNGNTWKKFYHPLANTITAMEFKNEYNGVVASLGEIAILKNNSWQFLTPPTATQLLSLAVQNDSVIWVLAFDGILYKYDNVWKSIGNKNDIHKMDLFNNEIYVIGNNFLGIVESDTVKIITTNEKLSLVNSFTVLKDSSIIIVGLDGTISTYKNKVWRNLESPVKTRLNSIVMLNSEDGWCAGMDGTLLHYTRNTNNKLTQKVWKGFDKVTLHANSKLIDDEYGVVTEDFNNDGLVDIFTCGLYENNHLYMNNGNISFLDEATERGVSGKLDDKKAIKEYNLGACSADFDNDGNIDLYVSSLNGKNKFYKNTGDGFFVDYTFISNAGGEKTDRTNSISTADVDNDSDLDIFITNENSTNRLFLNNGAGLFSEITADVGLITKQGGTGCSFADIDNDGDLDLYVTNWSAKNILYKNQLNETSTLHFTDITDQANVGGYNYTKSNGLAFADIDNDADLDLFVANRKTSNRLYLNNGRGIFTDITEEFLGLDSTKSYGVVINDFDGDSFKDIYVSNVGENHFFKNINGKKFVDYTGKYNADINGYSTGSSSADFDNDGDLDLYIANYIGESSTILVNKKDSKNYIELNIEGITSNRSGIGTKIYAYENGYLNDTSHIIFYVEVNGGSGYGSINELKQIVPTFNNDQLDIKIIFPSSKIKTYKSINKSSVILVLEEVEANRYWTRIKQFLFRKFFDWHQLFDLIKWVFVLGLIIFSILHGRKKYKWLPKFIIGSSFFIVLNYYLLSLVFEYKGFIYSTLLPLASTITLLTVFHLFYDKVMLRKKIEIERQKLQEKLSRDLHDDLASTLGSISIYLELLKQAILNKSDNIWQLFDKSNNLLTNSKQTITDLIWTIKPTPEPVTNFATRIRENYSDIFRERNISFLISEEFVENKLLLSSVEKHNLYLIIKEAFNNILKHSNANKVFIIFSFKDQVKNIIIRDNGVGFSYSMKKVHGNGITNMTTRVNEINGNLEINSKLGDGTEIIITLAK